MIVLHHRGLNAVPAGRRRGRPGIDFSKPTVYINTSNILTSDVHWLITTIVKITLEIDDPILQNLKQLKKKEGKSMGRLVSDLLAQALRGDAGHVAGSPPVWISRPMGARVDLSDKVTLYQALAG